MKTSLSLLFLTILFLSPSAHACFFGIIGCEPTPTPVPSMLSCFKHFSGGPYIRTRCHGNASTEKSLDLIVIPKIENGKAVLYVLDEKDGRFRTKKINLDQNGRSLMSFQRAEEISINLDPADYQSSCRYGSEYFNNKVTLTVSYNPENPAQQLKVRHSNTVDQNAPQLRANDSLGPQTTQMILDQAAIEIAAAKAASPTNDAFQKDCRSMAEGIALMPQGSQEDGSQTRILSSQERLLNILAPASGTAKPGSHPQPSPSSGSATRVNN